MGRKSKGSGRKLVRRVQSENWTTENFKHEKQKDSKSCFNTILNCIRELITYTVSSIFTIIFFILFFLIKILLLLVVFLIDTYLYVRKKAGYIYQRLTFSPKVFKPKTRQIPKNMKLDSVPANGYSTLLLDLMEFYALCGNFVIGSEENVIITECNCFDDFLRKAKPEADEVLYLSACRNQFYIFVEILNETGVYHTTTGDLCEFLQVCWDIWNSVHAEANSIRDLDDKENWINLLQEQLDAKIYISCKNPATLYQCGILLLVWKFNTDKNSRLWKPWVPEPKNQRINDFYMQCLSKQSASSGFHDHENWYLLSQQFTEVD